MVKYLVQKLEPTINKFHKSLDTNTRITDETQKYLKMRNGSLEHLIQDLAEFNRKAVNQQHVQEQVVEHQTINK